MGIGTPVEPPSSSQTGRPTDLPNASQQATSRAVLAWLCPTQGVVHEVVDAVDLAWVPTQEDGRHLLDAGAESARMRGDVGGAERRALPPALGAVVAGDA